MRDSRPRTAPPAQGRPEAPRQESRRPSAYSDQAIERLFDGVRGDRGRPPRVEPPRAAPPPQQSPRSEAKPQPPRPPKPKDNNGNDKSRGH